jgi:REP element-mobilizing transposase RayT
MNRINAGAVHPLADAASGDAAYNAPRRLRRLHRVWPDRDGNISYLLTMCVDRRSHILDNNDTFQCLTTFLLESPPRYGWFGRRFVVMPDHLHLIAHMGHGAVRLGQWIKALKAVVGGLQRRELPAAGSGYTANNMTQHMSVGRVPPRGAPELTRIKRTWRWQAGYHDHKFRTPESESRKWEYICLNPVRGSLVKRPEEWPFGGEIFYDETGGPTLIRGTPPLFDAGMLIEGQGTPREGTRPAT